MTSPGSEVSVFDLPNLRRKPSFTTLKETLEALELKPTTWSKSETQPTGTLNEAALSRYLTGIISSSFEWFDESGGQDLEEKREILWELASKRMTERCGRSAMGELQRNWIIPASPNIPELEFQIREPPLTGDNLGFKTWGTAYSIAKVLERIGLLLPANLLGNKDETKVLELGAGTGLVGIAAAAIWSVDVLLTDLADIQANLDYNIQQNSAFVGSRGGNIKGHVLEWKDDDGLADHATQKFDIIIAADPLYDDEHPGLVVHMINRFIKRESFSRALVAVPFRDGNTTRMASNLKAGLEGNGFVLHHEGFEICKDDWEKGVGDDEVKCWWALFGV